MGVADLLLIHAPDLRPAPRVFEEFRGDAPERIAPLYDVAVRGVVSQRQLALREGQPSRACKDEREESCDRLLHVRLVDLTRRSPYISYRGVLFTVRIKFCR